MSYREVRSQTDNAYQSSIQQCVMTRRMAATTFDAKTIRIRNQ